MSTTTPIRATNQIEELKNYYYRVKPNPRNHALICLALNSALRISDLLNLRWKDVYHFQKNRFLDHIFLVEQKTRKESLVALNQSACNSLAFYLKHLNHPTEDSFLFPGKNVTHPLSRFQAFRIIQKAGEQLRFQQQISCHSLRKTFGYHAWKGGAPPALLMAIYNHSSYQITKRYLGIEQEDKDAIFLNTNL